MCATKKEKQLKIWNGRGCLVRSHKDPRWDNVREAHIYIAAYSRADANRLINEYTGMERNLTSELRDYFAEGCWGNPMKGITPERGIWVEFEKGKTPVRVI